MFKSLSRSRSLRSQRARGGGESPAPAPAGDQDVHPAPHGPESPVLGLDRPGPVSDAPPSPTHAKQVAPPVQDQGQNHITAGSPDPSHLSSSPPDNDGANAYVRRPLPEPPARSPARLAARQTAAERPSTSAGPASGSSTMLAEAASRPRPSASSRRMSKDDLYLSTHSSRSFRSYHIPIRGQLPSPHGSPRSRSPDPTIAVRTQTPDSVATAPIGMAIGSPSFAPPSQPPSTGGNWQPQLRGMDVRPPWEEEPTEPAPAKKPSKWRLFFSGKKSEAKERQGSTPDLVSTPMSEARPKTASSMRHPDDVGRSNTTATRKAKKITPSVVRANTEPAFEIPSSSTPVEPKTPKLSKPPKTPKLEPVPRKSSTKSLREGIKKSDISAPMPASAPPMPVSAPPLPPAPTPSKGGGFLDVDIPETKMERYSVMFNGILQPGAPPPKSNPRDSVFLKRQATMKRLQSIQDAIIEEEARARGESPPPRAHSPPKTEETQPAAPKDTTTTTTDDSDTRTTTVTAPPRSSHQSHAKSPSFSLFPMTPSAASNKGWINPATRSSTSPPTGGLSSPTKSRFELMDPPGRTTPIAPPPPIRSDTPESRTRSQISQQSQDIPILLDGDDRGRGGFPLPAQQPVGGARAEQRGYARGRSRSSSQSTQRSEQTLQAHEASQTRLPNAVFERTTKPAPLNITKGARPEQGQSRARSDSRSRIPQPIQTQQQHHFRQDQSALVLDSPTEPTAPRTTQRPNPSEPAWQMMSPPSSSISSASTSTSSRKRSPSSASSTYTQGSNYAATGGAYAPAAGHADEDAAGKSAVEVSIARQISVSRQQRTLLQRPGAGARPWMRDGTPAGSGAARMRKVGDEGERLGGTRAAKPTYMRVDSPEENRRSERIVVEGV